MTTKITILTLALSVAVSQAQDPPPEDERAKAARLAEKLANPVASLYSVPLQSNWDFGAGPTGDGLQFKLNVQPVIPVSINDDWNLISRTILPFVHQTDVTAPGSSQTGLSDTVQSIFLSPTEPGPGGLIWGVGPALLLPTATEALLGTEKWGAGPTFVVLKQQSGWTYGALGNHIWSYAGKSGRSDVNASFIQPFVAYITSTQTTFTINSESTYDWNTSQWTAPVNLMVAQLVKVGKVPVQFQVGARYYLDKPAQGPDWGLRFAVTLLFPKG